MKIYFIIDIQYYITLFPKLRLFFYFITANKTRHPNDGNAEVVIAARGVGSQFVRGQMLSRAVLCGAKDKGKEKGQVQGLIVIRYYLALQRAENGVTAMVTPFFCVQG